MREKKFKYDKNNDTAARGSGQWRFFESNDLNIKAMIEAGLEELKYRHRVKERFHELAVERGVLDTWKKMMNVTPLSMIQLFKYSTALRDFYLDVVNYYNGDEEVMCFEISYLAATLGVSIEEGAVALVGRVSGNGNSTCFS